MAQDVDRCVICLQFIIGCGQFILAGFAETFTTNSSSHYKRSGDYYSFYRGASCLSTPHTDFRMFIRTLCTNLLHMVYLLYSIMYTNLSQGSWIRRLLSAIVVPIVQKRLQPGQ